MIQKINAVKKFTQTVICGIRDCNCARNDEL